MGLDHFTAELQLDDNEQIARICEALDLNIVQDAQQPLVQIPKKVLSPILTLLHFAAINQIFNLELESLRIPLL